jgi:uncharacterized tellurite resistance protein B-like protein
MKFTDLLGVFRHGGTTQSHMKNLIEMAAADGHFHDSEKELLKKIAKRNGISESQLADIQKHPEKVQFEVPQDNQQKFYQLYDLVNMMSIDNHVHADEQDLCNLFAIKFGYKREVANELIDVIRQNIKNGSTADEAMKRAQLMIA